MAARRLRPPGPQWAPTDTRSLRQLVGSPLGVLDRQTPGHTPEWLGVPHAQLVTAHRQRVAGRRAQSAEHAAHAVDGAHGHLQLVAAHLGGHPLIFLVEEVLHRDPHRLHVATGAVDVLDGSDRPGGQLGAGAQGGGGLGGHTAQADLQLALVRRPGGDARSHHFELRLVGHRLTLPPRRARLPGAAPGGANRGQPRIS